MGDLESENYWDTVTEEEFQHTFRMSRKSFISLQAELDVMENVDNEDTDRKLLFCLWYLGSTHSVHDARVIFNIREDLEEILTQYYEKINSLGGMYLAWPDEDEAKQIEEGFEKNYGFPGVLGVIGCLHINITSQRKNSIYYNTEMKRDTIVLQIVSDNNLLIRDVCAGSPGGGSIEMILKSSPLFQRLTNQNEYLIRSNKHLLGGTLHPQMKTLLTPYKGQKLTERQNKFNVLHNSVMYNVEQTFRCMENRFPRLMVVDNLEPTICTLLVTAICILHNFTRVRNDHCSIYM